MLRFASILVIVLLFLPVLSSTFIDVFGYQIPVGALSFFISFFLYFNYRVKLSKTSLFAPVVCLLALYIGVIPFLLTPSYQASNLKSLLYYSFLILYFFTGYLLPSVCKKLGVSFDKCIIVFALILSLYGIYTFVAQYYDLPFVLGFLRTSNQDGSLDIYTGWYHYYRAYSIYLEPSYVAIPATFLFSIYICKVYGLSLAKKLSIGTPFLIFCLLTFSRSVWLAFILFLIFSIKLPVIRLLNTRVFKASLMLSVILISLAVPLFFTVYSELSFDIRFNTIKNAIDVISGIFPLGTGLRVLPNEYAYYEPLTSSISTHIHSSLSSLTFWIGLPGLILGLTPTIFLLSAKPSAYTYNQSASLTYYAITTFILISLFGDYIHLSDYWFYFGVIVSYIKEHPSPQCRIHNTSYSSQISVY